MASIDFTPEKFLFDYEGTDVDFARCAWPIATHVFIIYRGMVVTYNVIVFALDPYLFSKNYNVPYEWWKNYIYVDRWHNLLAVIYFIIAFVSQIKIAKLTAPRVEPRSQRGTLISESNLSSSMNSGNGEDDGGVKKTQLSWYLKLRWILLNIISNMGIFIGIVFWPMYHDPDDLFFSDFHRHLIVLSMIVLEVFLVSHPMYLQHFWHSQVFLTFYIIFGGIYLGLGLTDQRGRQQLSLMVNIHERPTQTALMTITTLLLVIPVMQFVLVLLVRLRQWLIARGRKGKRTISTESMNGEITPKQRTSIERTSLYDKEFERRITNVYVKSKRQRDSQRSRDAKNLGQDLNVFRDYEFLESEERGVEY